MTLHSRNLAALIVSLLLYYQPTSQAESASSPEVFLKSVQEYDFKKDPEGFKGYLSIEEPRQPEQPSKWVLPKKITESTILWQSADRALLAIKARPETDGNPSETALLIALQRFDRAGWIISDKRPFKATGKYAGIQLEITSQSQAPYPDQGPVTTITVREGGRGASRAISASYELLNGRLILTPL
jgi:hypothetical protein